MYVFRPGSGFSGLSIKVEAGFQMEECSQESLFSEGLSGVASGDVQVESKSVGNVTELDTDLVLATPENR